jgi:hypothetical protein
VDVLTTLDLGAEDEHTIAARLDHGMPTLALSGVRYVVVDLGDRARLSRKTAEAVALAHRELRAMGGQMVVVGTPKAAQRCTRECSSLMIAATLRQARDALGPGALPTD